MYEVSPPNLVLRLSHSWFQFLATSGARRCFIDGEISLKRVIGKEFSRVLLVYFQTSPVPHHEKKMLMLPETSLSTRHRNLSL